MLSFFHQNIFLIVVLFLINDAKSQIIKILLSEVYLDSVEINSANTNNNRYDNKRFLSMQYTSAINYKNKIYTSKLKIGSYDQEFNVQLDTGSSLLWVSDANSNNSDYKNTFKCVPISLSSCQLINPNVSQVYESGSINGE